MSTRRLATAALAMALIALPTFAGCIVETSPNPPPTTTSPGPSSTGTPVGADASSTTAPHVPIDVDRSLIIDPGAGAGVFVTTTSAGHWDIGWTCDTKVSSQSCGFDLALRVSSATQNLAASSTSTTLSQGTDGQVHVSATTSLTVEHVSFDADPRAHVVLSAYINGQPHPSLVFFVANGALDTAPTDPIELVPVSGK